MHKLGGRPCRIPRSFSNCQVTARELLGAVHLPDILKNHGEDACASRNAIRLDTQSDCQTNSISLSLLTSVMEIPVQVRRRLNSGPVGGEAAKGTGAI